MAIRFCQQVSTMPLKVEIEPEQLIEREKDGCGRFTLGSEYANQSVKLLIISDGEDGNEE